MPIAAASTPSAGLHACEQWLEFQAIKALDRPDPRAISKFRRCCPAALACLLLQVLRLYCQAGLIGLGLPVGPGVIGLGQPVLDPMLFADAVEDVAAEHRDDLGVAATVLWQVGEGHAVVGEHGVDCVGKVATT